MTSGVLLSGLQTKVLYAFLVSLILYVPYIAEKITNSEMRLLLMVQQLRLYVYDVAEAMCLMT